MSDLDEVVRELMEECIGSKKKPNGYWKDIENVKRELEPIIEELGRFPTSKEIKKRNSTLGSAISQYHGGIRQMRTDFGEKQLQHPNYYWRNRENIIIHLDLIIAKLKRFPTSGEINQINSSLSAAISEYHGGIDKIRKIYGLKPLRKPSGYYQDMANVKKELDLIIEDLGRFPSCKEIVEINSGLMKAISKKHGGIGSLKIMYEEINQKKPNRYWQDIRNIELSLGPIVEELGRFPTDIEIRERNSSLSVSIYQYHSGLTAIKIKLGYADQELGILQEAMMELKDE